MVPEVGTLALDPTVTVLVLLLLPPNWNVLLDHPLDEPENEPVMVSPALAAQLPLYELVLSLEVKPWLSVLTPFLAITIVAVEGLPDPP